MSQQPTSKAVQCNVLFLLHLYFFPSITCLDMDGDWEMRETDKALGLSFGKRLFIFFTSLSKPVKFCTFAQNTPMLSDVRPKNRPHYFLSINPHWWADKPGHNATRHFYTECYPERRAVLYISATVVAALFECTEADLAPSSILDVEKVGGLGCWLNTIALIFFFSLTL